MAEGQVEVFDAPYDPEKPSGPSRKIALSRDLYIEQGDFAEQPPKKWFRLAPGQEVRLRYACLLKCEEVKKDAHGRVIELFCTWDPASRGGSSPDGRKVKGTLHWVSAPHALPAEVRLYDRLFKEEEPEKDKGVDWKTHLNPDSLHVVPGARVEASLASVQPLERFQFERLGYFTVDPDSKPGALVFNRTIALRDSWGAIAAKLA
jgi:glutaminyl-tRNA synthetase